MKMILRRLMLCLTRIPNLFMGYNFYVKPEKMALLRFAIDSVIPEARTFSDLGGVWKVNAAYTRCLVRHSRHLRGCIVDRNFSPRIVRMLSRFSNVRLIEGDFRDESVIARVGQVDVAIFFDVLLHQVDPDWSELLRRYANIANCLVIYNQQFVGRTQTIRLVDLPLEECKRLAPRRSDGLYDHIYEHKDEISPEHKRPWKDILDVWQWGITDADLRSVLCGLGFEEKFYHNYGKYGDLPHFENHGFIFLKRS